VSVQAGPVKQVIAHQPHAVLTGQRSCAEPTVRGVVTVLQPLEVGLDHARRVRGYHAVLAHVHAVLKAELVGHLALGALTETHGKVD